MAEDTALLDPLLNTSIDILIDSSESDSLLRVIEPQTSIAKEFDYDGLFPDSIWTNYMTRRGDYLSLIAYKEYNNANEWRRIYNWNRDEWEEYCRTDKRPKDIPAGPWDVYKKEWNLDGFLLPSYSCYNVPAIFLTQCSYRIRYS